MKARLLIIWNNLRSSFWFLPLLIIFSTILFTTAIVYTDYWIEFKPQGTLNFIFSSTVDSARSILSTIAGAMIGVAGTVFSITLVALTLASNNFGSRMLKNFMHSTLNQVVLGLYISTYVYCLLVLNVINGNKGEVFVPTFSVLFAIMFAVINIIFLIIFIHQIAISIQAESVIKDIVEEYNNALKSAELDHTIDATSLDTPPNNAIYYKQYLLRRPLKISGKGYIQSIDFPHITELAETHNCLIELTIKPGDFIVNNQIIGYIHSHVLLEDKVHTDITESIIIGRQRSGNQDIQFKILQLVEIASRALSPGVNDPFTAISCINYLTHMIVCVADKKFPSPILLSKEKNIRLVRPVVSFEDLVNAAFNQIRQYSISNHAVSIQLLDSLKILHAFTVGKERDLIIREHSQMVYRLTQEYFTEEKDMRIVKEKVKEIWN